MKKNIKTFENYINEKSKDMNYTIEYDVELDGDISKNRYFLLFNNGSVESVYFAGSKYYITKVQGKITDDFTDVTVELCNVDEDIILRWHGDNERSKVDISDIGWIKTNHITREVIQHGTISDVIKDLVAYVDEKYKDNDMEVDRAIGENMQNCSNELDNVSDNINIKI